MATQQLSFYSLKLTKEECNKLLNAPSNSKPSNFLICFVMDKTGGLGFKAAIFLQYEDGNLSSENILLTRLDSTSYVVECPTYFSINTVKVDDIISIFENYGSSYLTMRPYLLDNKYIAYDIDDPNEDSDTEILAEIVSIPTASNSSTKTNPSPPLITPPM